VPTLVYCTGFEHGTTAGMATGNAGNRLADFISTPAITTTAPRTGTYALNLTGTGAARVVELDANSFGTTRHHVGGVALKFSGALPSNDLDVITFQTVGSSNGFIRFRNSDDKLTAVIGGGTVQDGPVVVADRWYWIDWHYDSSANPHVLKWQIYDATAGTVTTVTDTTFAQAAADHEFFDLGRITSQAGTVHYDDFVLSSTAADYPLGPHKVVGLSVDPAGTVTLSGTTANFQTFTGNGGTKTAWNATTARNNIDEIPPTISSSADGFIQITNAASDYVQIPMTSYTLQPGETISGVRMVAPGFADTTTAATIGFRSWNGSTERTLFAVGDPNFDNSTSAPAWVCKMLTLADVDTQSELDALEFRVGFSGDAAPDIGIHAIYAEVAVKQPTNAAAELVTAAAEALDATASVKPSAELVTAAAEASDATVTTDEGGTDAPAELVDVAASALDVSASIAPTAELVDAASAALDATVQTAVVASAELVDVAGAALDVTSQIAPTAELASAAASTQDPSAAIGPTAELASATGEALDGTVQTATSAPAGLVDVAASAPDPTAAVAPTAELVTAAAEALDATTTVAPTAELVQVNGEALDATVQTGTHTNAPAELVDVAAQALDPSTAVAPTGELVSAVASALDAFVAVAPTAESVTATGTAYDPTVSTSVSVFAEVATASASALGASTSVAPVVGIAQAIAEALDAAVNAVVAGMFKSLGGTVITRGLAGTVTVSDLGGDVAVATLGGTVVVG
jgi:hypothetical protein